MKKLKTIIVWLFFGYDNRPVRSLIKYSESNLRTLASLIGPGKVYDYETYEISVDVDAVPYTILEHKGYIYLKPFLQNAIILKIVLLICLHGAFFPNFGLFWAVVSFSILNYSTLILQYKNLQILKLKIIKVEDYINLRAYYKTLRLKLSLERLTYFKHYAVSDYENHIQKQDVLYVREMIKDQDFINSRYSKFIFDLEWFINEQDLELSNYEDIMSLLNDELKYSFEIRSRMLRMIKKKIDSSTLEELSFFEDYML